MYILGKAYEKQYQIFSSDDQKGDTYNRNKEVESCNELELTPMSNNEEEYNNIPWRIKEDLGYPNNYYQLSYEQKVFIDYLLDKVVEMSDNIESLETEIEADQRTLATVEEMNVELEHKIEILQKQLEE
jgi:hypothetical protein